MWAVFRFIRIVGASMQLVAVKRISDQLTEGAIFEQEDSRARILMALGLATPYEVPTPHLPPTTRTYRRRSVADDPAEPEPAA